MFFDVGTDGKILICADEQIKDTMLELTPPDSFVPDEMHDWRIADGEFVYEPLPKPEKPISDAERIDALEEKLRAAEILLGLEE